MKKFARKLALMFLASLPIASISFAAQKALKLGELKGSENKPEGASAPSSTIG